VYRKYHQGQLTFAMVYEYSERFVMPLSHDEVVHLKRSLLNKMPGDAWQRFANLRLLLAYQYTRPGKKLVFMGTELAAPEEWNHDGSLPWHLQHAPMHREFGLFMAELGRLYRERSELWRRDHDFDGFSWIDVADEANSVLSYVRRDGDRHAVVVLNLTPVPREHYRIGAPAPGSYVQLLSTDEERFGGSGFSPTPRVATEPSPFHGYPQSMRLTLPPLGAVVLAHEPSAPTEAPPHGIAPAVP
jgi:1,4-alpha-glucan branching enzyme